MDKYQKETYLKANEYYQNGEYEKARRLWESLHGKNILKTPHSLIWKNVKLSFSQNKIFTFGFLLSLGLIVSLFFGRLNFVVYVLFSEFIQYKNSSGLVAFFVERSTIEYQLAKDFMGNASFYNPFLLVSEIFSTVNNYLVAKMGQTHLQISYFFSINSGVLSVERWVLATFFVAPISFFVFCFSLFFDLYLFYKISQFTGSFIRKICASHILLKRFVVCLFVLFFLSSYYFIVYAHFKKQHTESLDLMSFFAGGDGGGGGGGAQGARKQKKSESEFLDEMLKDYLNKPLSLKERKQLEKIKADILKAMQKMQISGSNDSNRSSGGELSKKINEMIMEGRYEDIFKLLEQMKAKENLKDLSKGGGVNLDEKDKEFSDVLKQSFKSSSQKTLEEFMKTSKELDELYGKDVHEQIFGGSTDKEMMQKFMKNPEEAKREMRKVAREALRKQSGEFLQVQDDRGRDVTSEMNSIINYLEGGGDIKIFNQMRVRFIEKYENPNIRFIFAKKIDFVIASWNEHQNKYFWQMNRELMLETIDMVMSAAKEINYDVRGLNLDWFFLVAGNYREARRHGLASAQYNESQRGEVAYVNRSNSALAALMLDEGQTAYVEYKYVQQAILSKTGFTRRDREEYLTEYLREITAAIASPSPCKEAFLCRSLFLEGVDDELAIKDLVRYLALSPQNQLLKKEAELKLKLLKERLESVNGR